MIINLVSKCEDDRHHHDHDDDEPLPKLCSEYYKFQGFVITKRSQTGLMMTI